MEHSITQNDVRLALRARGYSHLDIEIYFKEERWWTGERLKKLKTALGYIFERQKTDQRAETGEAIRLFRELFPNTCFDVENY